MDAIIELEDGSWCVIEIKLGINQIDSIANNLVKINNAIMKNGGKSAKSLCAICGLTNAAYKRSDWSICCTYNFIEKLILLYLTYWQHQKNAAVLIHS